MSFLISLLASPWALQKEIVPLVGRVLGRIARGEPISEADRAEVEAGKVAAAARRQSSAQYTGKNGSITVIQVLGILTPRGDFIDISTQTTSMQRLTAAVQTAAADPAIAGIILDIDSPGGSVQGTEEFAQAVFDARQVKPVTAVANSLAASAAYWVASQASELYASPGAEVGSIGVYTIHNDISGALRQDGIAVEIISAGKHKTELAPYGPLSPEARAHVQSTVDQYYASFVAAVARGRGKTLGAVRDGMGQGRTYLPADAKAAGMIDGVATLAQVVGKMQARLSRAGGNSSAVARQLEIDRLAGGSSSRTALLQETELMLAREGVTAAGVTAQLPPAPALSKEEQIRVELRKCASAIERDSLQNIIAHARAGASASTVRRLADMRRKCAASEAEVERCDRVMRLIGELDPQRPTKAQLQREIDILLLS